LISGVDALAEQLQEQAAGQTAVAQPNLISDLVYLLRDQCSVVGHILSDVLSLQKIEEGKFDLEMAPFSPELQVQNTVDSFRPSLQRKQLQVNLQLQPLDLGPFMTGQLLGLPISSQALPRPQTLLIGVDDIDASLPLTLKTQSSRGFDDTTESKPSHSVISGSTAPHENQACSPLPNHDSLALHTANGAVSHEDRSASTHLLIGGEYARRKFSSII